MPMTRSQQGRLHQIQIRHQQYPVRFELNYWMNRLLLLLLALLCCISAEELTLTYITQHELDQADNFVEVSLTLALEGKSLRMCISEAEEIIEDIKRISAEYCKKYATKEERQGCAELIEVSEFEVEPKYHNIRKVQTFSSFIIAYEITLAVHYTKAVGSLIDAILIAGGENIVIDDIVWKAHKEQDAQVNAIREGIAQGEQICQKFGKKLVEIISVQELDEGEEEQDVDEQRDEDLAEVEVELTTMRFKVKCDGKDGAKK